MIGPFYLEQANGGRLSERTSCRPITEATHSVGNGRYLARIESVEHSVARVWRRLQPSTTAGHPADNGAATKHSGIEPISERRLTAWSCRTLFAHKTEAATGIGIELGIDTRAQRTSLDRASIHRDQCGMRVPPPCGLRSNWLSQPATE